MRWKWIIENEYQVSDSGLVRRVSYTSFNKRGNPRLLSDRTLSANKYSNGYLFAAIKNKGYLIHRLVANAFIPNPKKLPCVNHKDGNKQNNQYTNLEWVTYSENHIHAYRQLGRVSYWKGRKNELHAKSKKVAKLDSDGITIKEFQSARQAAIEVNISLGGVAKSIREGYKIKGFRYKYVE